MRFLLIYPPSKSFFIETKKIFYGMAPPLGLLHIARVLEDEEGWGLSSSVWS